MISGLQLADYSCPWCPGKPVTREKKLPQDKTKYFGKGSKENLQGVS